MCQDSPESKRIMENRNLRKLDISWTQRMGSQPWLWLVVIAVALGRPLAARGSEMQPAWKHFRGICDASAMEMLDNDLFLVADDEDNVLRIYSRSQQGLPIATYDFAQFLGLVKRKKEIDFEGSARIGDHIFFISSHGANAKGKVQPSRHRIFAVEVTAHERPQIRPVGFYSRLVADLIRAPELSAFHFGRAAALPPKSPDALNIEGLAGTPEGHLLVGFRNPVPGGKALILPILNPMDLLRDQSAKFGEPLQVNLSGMGIRSLTRYRDGYLIIGGSYSGDLASRLFQWNGASTEATLITKGAGMPGNPEGMAVLTNAGRDLLFALSDDGTTRIGDCECKKLKDSTLKVFSAYEMTLGVHWTRN